MVEQQLIISTAPITLNEIRYFLQEKPQVELSAKCLQRVERSREVIEEIIQKGKVVYGVNTGFGKFADVRIQLEQTADLQRRLVLSHAAGVGEPVPADIVRLMMLLKVKNLSQGFSGVRPVVVQRLIDLLNHGIIPLVPMKGSVGASGDLAPLAHMALALIGEGKAFVKGKLLSAAEALKKFNLQPLELAAKEGLAILNGTQAIQAYGVYALLKAQNLVKTADVIGAMSLEALLGTLTAFDDRIQKIRNHPGQRLVAHNFRRLLNESPIVESHRFSEHKVQDAYSLRCIPQVHGAIRDGLQHVQEVFIREINGVTDNPLVFPDNGDVLSGGNFHGQPVAMAADYLSILMAELADISERRIEHMMDPTVSEMAGFLTEEGGLNSGFMIAQVTAAALTSENKVLAHPASVDSIPTSANKEDHVSMGAHAARKALEIIGNAENVLAVELVAAAQALDLRAPLTPAPATAQVLSLVRSQIAHWKEDRIMYIAIDKAREMIASGAVVEAAEKIEGELE